GRHVFANGRDSAIRPVIPKLESDESCQDETCNDCRRLPEVAGSPEEINAVQEADEERRGGERRKSATDVADQENEKNNDVDIVQAGGIGANEGANENYRRTRGAHNARDQGAERQNGGIGERRSAQIAGQKNSAGDHIKREQEHDEAQI